MTTKFRKEKYITQSKSELTNKWTFRVRIGKNAKSFAEKDYDDAASAFAYAKRYRDQVLANGIEMVTNGNKKSVKDVFEESYTLFPVRAETRRKLDGFFNKYINCKDKPISKVKSDDILLDLNAMIEVATDDTIQRVFSIWKKIIQTAIYKEYIIKDYTLLIKCPTSHKTPYFSVNKVTDRQTIIDMENFCEKHLKLSHDAFIVPLLIEFLYLTGCRICEALALTRKDISDVISISKEIGSDLSNKQVVRKCKTKLSVREIPITESIKEVLNKAMKYHKNEYIFSKEDGSFYDSTNLGDRIHRIGKKYGYDFNLYSIRHLFATDLTIAGVDDRTRMELMGHSNIKTNLGYARSNKELKENALNNR